DGFDDSTAEAAAELDAIERYASAEALRPVENSPFLSLGLWGETPETQLEAASDAFAAGDLQTSVRASDTAAVTWSSAEAVGQGRAFSIATIVLALVMLLALLVTTARRRRRRHVRMQATRIRS
ncbi:MAG: hypothetical protein ACRDIL_06615, partial [Candidatus Limnocylindrales bacterium]